APPAAIGIAQAPPHRLPRVTSPVFLFPPFFPCRRASTSCGWRRGLRGWSGVCLNRGRGRAVLPPLSITRDRGTSGARGTPATGHSLPIHPLLSHPARHQPPLYPFRSVPPALLTFPLSRCLMGYEQSAAREHGQVPLRHGE